MFLYSTHFFLLPRVTWKGWKSKNIKNLNCFNCGVPMCKTARPAAGQNWTIKNSLLKFWTACEFVKRDLIFALRDVWNDSYSPSTFHPRRRPSLECFILVLMAPEWMGFKCCTRRVRSCVNRKSQTKNRKLNIWIKKIFSLCWVLCEKRKEIHFQDLMKMFVLIPFCPLTLILRFAVWKREEIKTRHCVNFYILLNIQISMNRKCFYGN